VLNAGAGTGSYESDAGGRRFVAVEPSAVMLAQRTTARAEGQDARRPAQLAQITSAVQAVAERLPFPDQSFDAATAILTIHHWPDPKAGLDEIRRVTRGPIVILTWDTTWFADFWLTSEYVPEAAAHDASLVALADVERFVGDCRVEVVPVPHDCTDGFFAAYWRRPEMYLDPGARAAISGLALLPPAVLERMAATLAADLESGEWHRNHADLLDLDSIDFGYRLVISDR
jgi:SAM-dependent methyltransferase